MPVFPLFPPSLRKLRLAALLLLTAALLLQVGWACNTAYSHLQKASQEAQQRLEGAALTTAHKLSLWLNVADEAVATLVLSPDAHGGPPQSIAQSGLHIPPQLWFTATQGQPLLSAPVTLAGVKYMVWAHPSPDGNTVLQARPLSALHSLLATAESERIKGAILLHTRAGEVLVYNTPPVDKLRQALLQPEQTAEGCALQPLTLGLPPLEPTADIASVQPPLGIVGFSSSAHLPSLPHRLVALLAQSPLYWSWQGLCAALCATLLWGLAWHGGQAPPPTAGPVTSDLSTSLQAQLRVTTEQLQTETALRRQLSGQFIRLLEDMRLALGRELHDQTGQRLAALLLRLETRPSIQPPEILLAETVTELRHIQTDVRHLAHGLRPPALGIMGLGTALRSLGDDYAKAGLQIHYFENQIPALDTERALALYRVAQEALTNAVKHARAQNVFVSLVGCGAKLVLTIEDDGQGFAGSGGMTEPPAPAAKACAPAPPPCGAGMGLLLMRERMNQWGGQLTVDSATGKGCTIVAELPL